MGNSNAKKTNQLLGQQQDLTRGYGDWAKGISQQEYARNQGLQDLITQGVGSMWGRLGQGVSAGPGSFHDPYMSTSQPFYTKAMDTGLFTPEQENDYRARGALQNTALFAGLKRQLDQAANVRGGGFAGYSGQGQLLSRDAARQAEENRLNTESSLQDMIRKNMFSGAQGVQSNDNTYQGLLQNTDQQRNQYALANAGLGLQGMGQQANLLGLLAGLRGNDLGYAQLAGNEYGQGLNAINSRVPETPWWQTALGAASGLAGTALPFLGGGPRTSRPQSQRIYGPTNSELGYGG